MSGQRGFTLLEVLVALTILGLGAVALIQLSAQGLRLVKQSDDHQGAILLADRLAKETAPVAEGLESGKEGALTWERRISRIGTPEALQPPSGPTPRLLALTVTVRWSRDASLTLATLRTAPSP
jgi:prepilin-type N-terminal cleavage/methylation domain-containing protein